ncbi:hypothetical protein D3C87_35080 [compost metagenome]
MSEKYVIKSNGQKIASLHEEGYLSPINHKFVIKDSSPLNGLNTEMAFVIVETLLKEVSNNRKQWKKDNHTYTLDWNDYITGKSECSKSVNYKIVAELLRKKGLYDPKDLNLPPLECLWLDKSVDLSINFHKFDPGKKNAVTMKDGTPKLQFGEDYPITPSLDREGQFFTTLHPQLIKRLIRDRTNLIKNSDLALDNDWILDLRTLVNDSISLVDITLNSFYIKAEFSPKENWSFDKSIIGKRIGRRLFDKIKWVKLITGENLNIESEKQSLIRLKNFRNHLNHFDPPSLAISIEEAVELLNDVLQVGVILKKMRDCFGELVSTDLMNLLLQKKALFNPLPDFAKRLPINNEHGYQSSTWK